MSKFNVRLDYTQHEHYVFVDTIEAEDAEAALTEAQKQFNFDPSVYANSEYYWTTDNIIIEHVADFEED